MKVIERVLERQIRTLISLLSDFNPIYIYIYIIAGGLITNLGSPQQKSVFSGIFGEI